MSSLNHLQKRIMRRVYYTFALRLGVHPVTVGLVFAAVSLYLLGKLVFVARVVDGFLNIPVKDLIPHTVGVLSNADILTLAVFAACLASVAYVVYNLATIRHHGVPRMRLA